MCYEIMHTQRIYRRTLVLQAATMKRICVTGRCCRHCEDVCVNGEDAIKSIREHVMILSAQRSEEGSSIYLQIPYLYLSKAFLVVRSSETEKQ